MKFYSMTENCVWKCVCVCGVFEKCLLQFFYEDAEAIHVSFSKTPLTIKWNFPSFENFSPKSWKAEKVI